MALDRIHLGKLLKILFLEPNKRRSEIRKDIRNDIRAAAGQSSSGGDFYVPFWSDAKRHAFGEGDLHAAVEGRIGANGGRKSLYTQLRDGFLLWWSKRRRWTNAPFQPGQQYKAQFPFPGLDATVKVENIMSVRDGAGVEHIVYPYFAPHPKLAEHGARLGLWLLAQALPNAQPEEIRILDVIRGQTFSLDRNPLTGDEQRDFQARYDALLREWKDLKEEYR